MNAMIREYIKCILKRLYIILKLRYVRNSLSIIIIKNHSEISDHGKIIYIFQSYSNIGSFHPDY